VSTDDQMSVEDRVRAATRAGASLINDVRPLDAPAPVRLRRRPGPGKRRWASWGGPLAAAAAVAAIALTLVAVRQGGSPAPATTGTGTAAPTAIPRYYVEPTYDIHAQRSGPLIVGDDRTGKAIATIAPPSGLAFNYAVATAEDETFVVEASVPTTPYGAPPFTWFLLRVTPGGARPYQLTRLPVRLPGNETYSRAFAVSPDGRELAVESSPGGAKAKPVTTVGIYSVATGVQLRAWTAPRQVMTELAAGHTLSWLRGGRQLAFNAATGPANRTQLRTLDVTGTGTDLIADSRAVFTADRPGMSSCRSLQVTPDGGTAICSTGVGPDPRSGPGCANGGLAFIAFSLTSSSQPGRVLYQYRGACADAESFTLWTDASGSAIIGMTRINTASRGEKNTFTVGVITGGRFRPLDIAKSVPADGYADLTF